MNFANEEAICAPVKNFKVKRSLQLSKEPGLIEPSRDTGKLTTMDEMAAGNGGQSYFSEPQTTDKF